MMGKLIEAKDERVSKRENLTEVIPLPFPYLLYIEPTNACNFKCLFCPTGDPDLLKKVGRKTEMMPFELFCKMIDEVRNSGRKLRLVSLYKDGEPLLHPQFCDMVRYVRDSGITDRIWTKTNGALLTPELSQKIVDSGLTWMGISVEAVDADGYLKITGQKLDYDRFLENIAYLHSVKKDMHLYIKIADTNLTAEQKQKFANDFAPYCDSYAIEKLMGWSYSGVKDFTLGTNPDTYDGLPLVKKDVCAYPFYVMAVNADGSVSLCGNDWAHATVVGNIHNETLHDIWNGERLFRFRKMMLEKRRCENKACGDCYYLQIVPDNLDNDRELILKHLEAQKNK